MASTDQQAEYRAHMIALEGPGDRPCFTSRKNWLGCPYGPDDESHTCYAVLRQCILAPFDRVRHDEERAEERKRELAAVREVLETLPKRRSFGNYKSKSA